MVGKTLELAALVSPIPKANVYYKSRKVSDEVQIQVLEVTTLIIYTTFIPFLISHQNNTITHFKYQNCRGTQSKQTSDPIRQSKDWLKLI